MPGPRRRRLALLATAAAVLLAISLGIAWLQQSRSSDGGSVRRGAAAGTSRDLGPTARPLGRRHAPTAKDVLGALGAAIPRQGLVRVEGRVVDALTRTPVGGVEVVFDGDAGEATAVADASGSYAIDVVPGDYRAFVRGDHVISVGPAHYQRLPTAPDPTTASVPDDRIAPLLAVSDDQRGVDLEVQRSGIVTGRVLDPGGRPIANAVVRAEVGGWQPVLGTNVAETDASGRFRLEVPAGFYELSAAHDDYAGAGPDPNDPYGRPNVTVFPEMETERDLTMARGCVITGKAVRRDGSPSGAGALERGVGDTSYPAGPVADDGTFRYTTTLAEDVRLRVWPWKSPPAEYQELACRDGARFDVTFVIPDAPPSLMGTIVDARGNPVSTAYIDVYGLTPGTMNQQERSDASGEWGVFALPPGEYAISAHVVGLGVARARVTSPSSGIALRLSGTGAIAGRIEGVADGETFQLEVGGCRADDGPVVMPPTTRLVPVVGGAYFVDGLPACRLIASARSADRARALELPVVADDTTTIDLDLTPPRQKTVRLRVLTPDGAPVAGAQAMAMSATSRAPAGPAVTTDASGAAELTAGVGDLITVFTGTSGPEEALIGHAAVSDAPGAEEEIELRLTPVSLYSP